MFLNSVRQEGMHISENLLRNLSHKITLCEIHISRIRVQQQACGYVCIQKSMHACAYTHVLFYLIISDLI